MVSNKPGSKGKILNKKTVLIMLAVVLLTGAGMAAYILQASDNPAFCTSCHIMDSYYRSWEDSSLLAHKHSLENVACHDCHQATLSEQVHEAITYATGSYATPLEKREFSKDFCLECHDDFEAVKAATEFEESNPHDSHNGEQECNVCHSMHQPSKVMCSECHVFGWIDELDESWSHE